MFLHLGYDVSMMAPIRKRQLDELMLSGTKHHYDKGEILQQSDSSLYLTLVTKGYVKRYLITNEGSISIQTIFGPKYIFPLTQVFELLFNYRIYSGPETFYYEAMTDVEIYKLDNDTLCRSVEHDPLLYRDLLAVSGRRLLSNIHKLENISLHSSYERVAHQLLHLAREFGKKTPEGISIQVPLTQSDIASMLSITRGTTSRSLGQLKAKKIIFGDKHLLIPDIGKLSKAAYGTT